MKAKAYRDAKNAEGVNKKVVYHHFKAKSARAYRDLVNKRAA